MSLSNLLRGPRKPPAEASSTDLRATLRETETQRDAAAARLAELEAALGDILLDDDADAEAQHQAAKREAAEKLARAEAVIGALHPRIEAAEQREAEAFLRLQSDTAERIAAEAVEHVLAYDKAAREMLAAVERVNTASAFVVAANRRMAERGRTDLFVVPPLNRLWEHNRNDKITSICVCGPRRLARTLADYEAAVAEAPPPRPVHPKSEAQLAQEADRAWWNGVVATIERCR
ncbi:hypothetical protein AAFN86_28240 [Roseomonas sp. CAU 1739]|uniref:hypothetical protein n=1 Tax=Roseomonas sp. CAU 1739 TaxID=3140364 RepID=UPI00325B0ECF